MLEGLVLSAALVALPPAPSCPAYLPLPEAIAATATRPAAQPVDDMPSFPIPVTRRPAPKHAAATPRPEATDDGLPSFPIAVPHQRPEETSDR